MKIGNFIQQKEGYKAFIPLQFPPQEAIEFDSQMQQLHAHAALKLGKLDGITQLLPDLDFFIFMYIRKEAALSSEIEGTQATMIDAVLAEADITKDLPHDVDRILHYIKAMNYGLQRLEDLPLSLRLIKEVHRLLLKGTGDEPGKTPGELRTSQNWIGGGSPATAKFVPPPEHEMHQALSDFEKFLHEGSNKYPPLLKTALMHAQFETIHPFLDGNGRTGRLLITFFLCQQEILERPVLYLSEYFKKHREVYFELLHNYHNKGEVVPWLKFFLVGVSEVSQEAIHVSREINQLREEGIEKIQSLGRRTEVGMVVLKKLFELPIVNARKIEEWTKLSRPSVNSLIKELLRLGILSQRYPKISYGRDFEYKKYLQLFSE